MLKLFHYLKQINFKKNTMKKAKKISLSLNKNIVSNLNQSQIKGGVSNTGCNQLSSNIPGACPTNYCKSLKGSCPIG